MNRKEFYAALTARIPATLSEAWDNDGVMCCPDAGKAVEKVLATLDVTDEVIAYAAENGFDLILSHHPLIFHGVTHMDGEESVSARLLRLCRENIAVFSFHTRLDAVKGGVNDTLAELLGLTGFAPFGGETGMGRIGLLKERMPAADFARHVARCLGCEGVLLAGAGGTVSRVAVLGGEGKDFVADAVKAGADAYVSGRFGYHTMLDAPICLIEAGHYYTERPVSYVLARMAREISPGLQTEAYTPNRLTFIKKGE